MNRQRDIDRVLEDWLAEGPSRMPDRLVSATVDQLDNVQQRKPWLPWSPTMNRLVTYAAGLAALLVIAVVAWSALGGQWGVGDRPSPSPSLTPTPTESFTSSRHGYTVQLPEGEWTFEEMPGSWAIGEFFDANSESGIDYYERPSAARPPALYAYIASQLMAGMSFEDWAATHDAANDVAVPCFDPFGDVESATVDGEPARVIVQHCPNFDVDNAWTTIQTLFVHGDRGYALYVWPQVQGALMPPPEDLKAESASWLSGFTFND